MEYKLRKPWQVTRSVWYALFMREALARTTADRFAWVWMLLEPIAMIVIMVLIRTVAFGKTQHIAGVEFVSWFIVGLFGFHLFRENMMRLIGAIDANKALFAYRQVKPIDPVLIRSFVESMLKTLIFLIFIFVGKLLDISLIPDQIITAFFYWISLWGLGLGLGLVLSVFSTLYSEIGRITKILSFPLLLVSGVLFPLHYVPNELQSYLLLNPIAHGVELLRGSFFVNYQVIAGVSELYLIIWCLITILIGLALHIKFEDELKAK